MTTLKDIWPAMTLFYDYIMPFIEKEFSIHKPLLYSFLKVQSKDTKLLIIRKDFIWSSYNIHFVSLHHYNVPSSSSSSPYNAAVNLKASTSPRFSSSNPRACLTGIEKFESEVSWLSIRIHVLYQWIYRCLR